LPGGHATALQIGRQLRGLLRPRCEYIDDARVQVTVVIESGLRQKRARVCLLDQVAQERFGKRLIWVSPGVATARMAELMMWSTITAATASMLAFVHVVFTSAQGERDSNPVIRGLSQSFSFDETAPFSFDHTMRKLKPVSLCW
jgi:hypothetical protein